jgi:penicillin-binding protein 2
MDISKAITRSCDVYFYWLATRMGIDPMHDYLVHFGFGSPTGIDLYGERAGLFPSREWKEKTRGVAWYPGETVITGVGQGFALVTPLQLAVATASLALPGQKVTPRLVRWLERPDGTIMLDEPGIELVELPMTEEDWRMVIDAMVDVIHTPRGTAQSTGIGAPYVIAGKTGTAQVFGLAEDEEYVEEETAVHLRDHALFIGFAPADDPRIAVAVVAENGGSGGRVAAPIARKVIDRYLSSVGL